MFSALPDIVSPGSFRFNRSPRGSWRLFPNRVKAIKISLPSSTFDYIFTKIVWQQQLLMAAEERGEYFWTHCWLLFVDLWGEVYSAAECLLVNIVSYTLFSFELAILNVLHSFQDFSKQKLCIRSRILLQVKKGISYSVPWKAVWQMEVGPPVTACRSSHQTALSCIC